MSSEDQSWLRTSEVLVHAGWDALLKYLWCWHSLCTADSCKSLFVYFWSTHCSNIIFMTWLGKFLYMAGLHRNKKIQETGCHGQLLWVIYGDNLSGKRQIAYTSCTKPAAHPQTHLALPQSWECSSVERNHQGPAAETSWVAVGFCRFQPAHETHNQKEEDNSGPNIVSKNPTIQAAQLAEQFISPLSSSGSARGTTAPKYTDHDCDLWVTAWEK